MGSSALGMYRFAINLASGPADKIGMLLMRVSSPLFANVQHDLAMVRRYFLLFTDALALILFPLMFGLAAVAPDFAVVMLGPRWTAVGAPLRWLAIYAILRTMNTLMGQVLTSLRQTRFTMWMSLLTAAVMVPAFFIASRWGPGAVAASWLVIAPLTIGPLMIRLLRSIQLSFGELFAVLGPALLGSAAMVAAVLATGGYLPRTAPAGLRLAIQVTTGGAVYSSILVIFYRQRLFRYVRFFRQLWRERSQAGAAACSSSAAV
jgi:O-antigen/teichoic acid export membrane protein